MSENIKQNFALWDDFSDAMMGTSVPVGETGWTVSMIGSGSIQGNSTVAGRIGVLRCITGAKSGDMIVLHRNPNFDLSQLAWDMKLAVRYNQTTDVIRRIGFSESPTAEPPFDGIYFEKLAADANWFATTRAVSTQTRTNTGVAASTNFEEFWFSSLASGGWEFSIDGVLKATNTTNVPTDMENFSIYIKTNANFLKSFDIDWVCGLLELPAR